MSNGFGAAFGALLVLAVLLVLAAVAGATALGSFLFRRRTGETYWLLPYIAALTLAGVVVVGGFGVLALLDELPPAAVLLLVSVFLPLGVVGVLLQRADDPDAVSLLASTVAAWSLPFAVGMVVFFGTMAAVQTVFDLTSGELRKLGIVWVAVAASGVVVVTGSVALREYVTPVVSRHPSARS